METGLELFNHHDFVAVYVRQLFEASFFLSYLDLKVVADAEIWLKKLIQVA